jgi:hypothetical protein
MTIAGDLLRDIKTLSGLLEEVRSELDNGATIDLDPLQPQVEDICQRAAGLPAGEEETIRPRLLALIDELNRLGAALEARVADLKGLLDGTGDRSRALEAYKRGTPSQ